MSQTLGTAPAGGEFRWPLRIYWEDTDAGGIVFYANYLKFFERSRTEWLRSLGVEQQKLREETGGMFIVSDTSVRYLRPARLDDELIVTAALQEKGRASMTIRQQAFLKPKDLSLQLAPGISQQGPQNRLCRAAGAAAPSGGSEPHEVGSVGVLLCEGTIRIGWVDPTTMRPSRIPTVILDCFPS